MALASAWNIVVIIQEGFDDRLTNRKFYGHGVYFTTDVCKAHQYTSFDATIRPANQHGRIQAVVQTFATGLAGIEDNRFLRTWSCLAYLTQNSIGIGPVTTSVWPRIACGVHG